MRVLLNDLLDNFSQFFEKIGLRFWIAHGTLLGWSWNGKTLPWDDDIDVQTTVLQLWYALKYNMDEWKGRYVFEINPNFVDRRLLRENVIDARFIDKETGAYIDITGKRMLL